MAGANAIAVVGGTDTDAAVGTVVVTVVDGAGAGAAVVADSTGPPQAANVDTESAKSQVVRERRTLQELLRGIR